MNILCFDDKNRIAIAADYKEWTARDFDELQSTFGIIYHGGKFGLWIEKRPQKTFLLHIMVEEDGLLMWELRNDLNFDENHIPDFMSLLNSSASYFRFH